MSIGTSEKSQLGFDPGQESRAGQTAAWPRRRLLFSLGAVLVLPACQTTRGKVVSRLSLPLPPPPPGLARIYFYRQDGKLFRAVEPQVVVNGRSAGISRPGEAFFRNAKPGRYQVFSTADPNELLYLEAQAGRLSFVEMEVAFSGIGFKLRPLERSAGQAAGALDGLSLVAAGT